MRIVRHGQGARGANLSSSAVVLEPRSALLPHDHDALMAEGDPFMPGMGDLDLETLFGSGQVARVFISRFHPLR